MRHAGKISENNTQLIQVNEVIKQLVTVEADMLLLLWKHASLIQYMWEILVTGVCIVPAWRLSPHGSFITQDSLLSLWCLY